MKRFLVFAGDTYYPRGGFEDFRASYDTEGEAKAYCDAFADDDALTWAHVVDTTTWTIVYSK